MKDIELNWQDLLFILVAFAPLGALSCVLLFAHYKYASTRPIKAKWPVSRTQKSNLPKPADRPLSMHLPV
jgi:hypothetical protein